MSKNKVVGTPADPTVPKVPVEVNGTTYSLCFDFNGLAVAEKESGLNLLTGIDLQKVSATQLRALIFAALVKFQPEITLETVGSMLTYANVPMFSEALAKALAASFPEPEAEPKNAEEPQESK